MSKGPKEYRRAGVSFKLYLRLCQYLADKVPHSQVVGKCHPWDADDEVAAELAGMGGVQLIHPLWFQLHPKLLPAGVAKIR